MGTRVASIASLTVSVVIPCYSAEGFVDEAIESALSQSQSPEEVVVVDNGSTDDSVRTATSFRSRVGLIQLRHTGVAAARNAGLSSVREDFVAWLDADDVWKPDKLECRLAKIGDPSVGLVYGQIQDIGNNTLGDPWPTSFRKGTFLSGYICSGILFPPRRCSCDDKRLEMQVDLIPL